MGDDGDRLAPVIPLFGGVTGRRPPGSSSEENRTGEGGSGGRTDPENVVPRRTGDAGLWRSTWDDLDADAPASPRSVGLPMEAPAGRRGAPDGLHSDASGRGGTSEREKGSHPARGSSERYVPRLRALRSGDEGGADDPSPADPEELRAAAEDLLVRKLRSKSLSVSEARSVLRGFEDRGQRIDAGQVDDILDDYGRRGYLDDATLAWHLVTSGVERKGQGRIALSRALAQRGIPREVIDEALAELPDDDAERAVEFARSKARAMSGLDPDTALRRLVGQLARRGYNGSVAMTAAKTALREAAFGRPASGVRFVDSD